MGFNSGFKGLNSNYLSIYLFSHSIVLSFILVSLTAVIGTLCQLFSTRFVHLFTAHPFIHWSANCCHRSSGRTSHV